VLATPEGRWQRGVRWLRRHRWGVAAGAMVFAALSVGLVAAVWQMKQAREQSRTAQAALAFMDEVFLANSIYQANPSKARAVTARELLDVGARRIETELADAPEAKLRMLKTMARMYRQLALSEEEASLARQRVALARSLHGDRHDERVDALLDLARATVSGPHKAEGLQALHEAAAVLDARGERDSLRRGTAELLAASDLLETDPLAALQRFDQALAILRRYPQSEELVDALSSKADAHGALRQSKPAQEVLLEGLALLPPGSARTATFHARLCLTQLSLNDPLNAETHCREALDTARRHLGADSPTTLENASMMAVFYMRSSRLAQTIALLENMLPMAVAAGEHDGHMQETQTRILLADAYLLHGRMEDSLRVARAAATLTNGRATLVEFRLRVLEVEARGLIEAGHFAEALSALHEADQLRQQRGRIDGPVYNTHLFARVHWMLAQGRGDEAAALAARFRVPADAAARPVAPEALERDSLRAESELARHRLDEAMSIAADVRERIAKSVSPPLLALWEQRMELVNGVARLEAQQPDRARVHLEHAIALAAKTLDANSPQLADMQAWLGLALVSGGHAEPAMALLDKARAVHAAHVELGPQHKDVLRRLESALESRRPAALRAKAR
jgi:tetratricopeptide (TPR) repeat protein